MHIKPCSIISSGFKTHAKEKIGRAHSHTVHLPAEKAGPPPLRAKEAAFHSLKHIKYTEEGGRGSKVTSADQRNY